MGCDIHVHTEIKLNGVWQHYGSPYVKRNYVLFALMADVRNEWGLRPISKPKGLPPDVTDLTRYAHTLDNYHDESWLGPEELKDLADAYDDEIERRGEPYPPYWHRGWWFEEKFDYFFGNAWWGDWPPGITDVRFVFWFDN